MKVVWAVLTLATVAWRLRLAGATPRLRASWARARRRCRSSAAWWATTPCRPPSRRCPPAALLGCASAAHRARSASSWPAPAAAAALRWLCRSRRSQQTATATTPRARASSGRRVQWPRASCAAWASRHWRCSAASCPSAWYVCFWLFCVKGLTRAAGRAAVGCAGQGCAVQVAYHCELRGVSEGAGRQHIQGAGRVTRAVWSLPHIFGLQRVGHGLCDVAQCVSVEAACGCAGSE